MADFDANAAAALSAAPQPATDPRPERKTVRAADQSAGRKRRQITAEERAERERRRAEEEAAARAEAMKVAAPLAGLVVGAANGAIPDAYREFRLEPDAAKELARLVAAVAVKYVPLEAAGEFQEEIELGMWLAVHAINSAKAMRARIAQERADAELEAAALAADYNKAESEISG